MADPGRMEASGDPRLLCEADNMQALTDAIEQLAGKCILVIGDVMLDTFVYGQCSRISPEAPIPVMRVEDEAVMLGGAGNVARNIAGLGGRAVLVGVVGDDAAGARLRKGIAAEAGIEADLVVDALRPTTQKTRFVAEGQQMLRADVERAAPCDTAPLLAALDRQLVKAQAVVFSDYAKGALTPAFLKAAIERVRAAGVPIVTDPKSADLSRYDGVSLLTPNASEALAASGINCAADADAAIAGERVLADVPGTHAVLITRGAQGMTLFERGGAPLHLPAVKREVFDVSGAGDTVIATLALGLAAGLELPLATELSNLAAGIAVGKRGTAIVTAEDLRAELRSSQVHSVERKIVSLSEAAQQVRSWRDAGERIGFTNGCFDLMHPGHISQLAQARAQCGRLIVGLNADSSISRIKGPSRPVQNQAARSIVLGALESVDLVVIFDEDTPLRLIETLRPEVLIKGKDYRVDQVVGADLVLGYGGEVFLADLVDGHSTTDIISRLLTQAA